MLSTSVLTYGIDIKFQKYDPTKVRFLFYLSVLSFCVSSLSSLWVFFCLKQGFIYQPPLIPIVLLLTFLTCFTGGLGPTGQRPPWQAVRVLKTFAPKLYLPPQCRSVSGGAAVAESYILDVGGAHRC